MDLIIYATDGNRVAVVTPAPGFTVAEILAKDIPPSVRSRVIKDTDLPPFSSRDRWRWTPAGPLLVEPEGPAPVPESITFPQMIAGLVDVGWITGAEARAWLTRTALPVAVQNVIASLPARQRFAAEARALSANAIMRNSPLVAALATAAGRTQADVDQFFRSAAVV